MILESDLEKAGLTKYEAKAYGALASLGESTTGPISRISGVPTSHLYDVLDQLIKKGLISTKLYNRKKVFQIGPPEALKEYFATKKQDMEQQEKSILNAMRQLKATPKATISMSNYQYFEGVSGIKSLFLQINEQMRPNSKAEVLSANVETWEKLEGFLREHHKVRVAKNVFERMILPSSGRRMASARKAIGHIEIRYLDHNNEAEYGVFGDLVAILYHGSKTPRGFLIRDTIFAQTFKNIFDMLWLQASRE